MRYLSFIILFSLLSIFMLAGCSSSSNSPLTPQENDTVGEIDNLPIIGASTFDDGSFNAIGMMGAYELSINPENNTAELVAKRTSAIGESYVVSGLGFFTVSPCPNCLQLKAISLTPDGNVELTFSISHPFEEGDDLKPPSAINRLDLDVFDLALVIAPLETVAATYSQTGTSVYAGFCVDTDGYTTELNEVIEDSSALPYFLVIDDSIGGASTFNKFKMGTKDFEFDATFSLASGTLMFDLYLTMGYGFSAVKADRLNPTYYNPEFNRKSAWKVDVTPPEGEDPPSQGNTWNSANNSTPYDVTVKVYDWQIGANVDPALANLTDIYAASGVSNVSVEIPGMNSALQTATTPDSGTGTPDDPLVYTFSIVNENLLAEDEYTGLVKVTDERAVGVIGDRDFIIDAPDGVTLGNYNLPEFATYQTFTATVVVGSTIELTAPNGGEEWRIGSNENITWTTTLYSGMIKLEYSKDGFVSDINEIIASTDDDSVYEWTILDDPSVTVRVRASLVDALTVYDDSDADFTLIEQSWANPVLIDTNSHMPRFVQNTDDDLVGLWHKNGQGIQYSYNDGTDWQSPVQAYNTIPTFMHILSANSGQTVYASYKGSGSGSGSRHALRWTGGTGAWNYMWLYGSTGQPSILLPDDDGSFTHIYTYSGGFQVIGFNAWASNWSGMAGWYDSYDCRMASTNFHERDNTNHFIAYHRNRSGLDAARFVRGFKSSIYSWTSHSIYQGVTGELVDSVSLSVDSTGTLHSVWRVEDGTDFRIDYASSTNNGTSWSTPEDLVSGTSAILKNYVGIDIDSTDMIYITYARDDAVYLICSNATGWDTPVTFIDVPGIPSGYHYTEPFPLITDDDVLQIYYVYKQTTATYGDLYEITN